MLSLFDLPGVSVDDIIPGAPYLDYRGIGSDERENLADLGDDSLDAESAEARGLNHAIDVAVPEHLASVRTFAWSKLWELGVEATGAYAQHA